jgi:uncharacterized membrane protein
MSRTVIIIPKSTKERLHTIVSIAALLFSFIYLASKWSELPDTIPTHFNSAGEADGWGSRYVLIILPLLALVLFIGFSVLSRFPHKFNYLVQITEENAYYQYSTGRLLLSWVKLEIVLLFSFIEYKVIQGALENSSSLGFTFFALLFVVLGTIVYFMIRMRK